MARNGEACLPVSHTSARTDATPMVAHKAPGRHGAKPGATHPVRSGNAPTLVHPDPATPIGSPRFTGLRAPDGVPHATASPWSRPGMQSDAVDSQSPASHGNSTAGKVALGNPGMVGSLECRASAMTATRPAPRASLNAQSATGLPLAPLASL